jgi:DNA-binding response OmpR family regulator
VNAASVQVLMGCRVLVVEDDENLREMMAQLLTLEGFDAEVASNGQDALNKAHAYRPSVIVLDMMMPVMDGWEFCIRQRRDSEIAAIPVIILSAAPLERLTTVGADTVLQKPFDYEGLLAAVRAHC